VTRLGPAQPILVGLDPAPQKRRRRENGLDKAQSIQIMFTKGVFDKTHPYALTIIFMPILI